MKNLFAVILLLAFCFSNAQEKSLEFGVKIGVNISSLSNYLDSNDEARKSILFGGYLEIPVNEKFSIAPELMFSSQGEVSNFETIDGKFQAITQLDYLNLPLIAKYYLFDSFALEAGPQIGFLVGTNRSLQSDGEFNGDFEALYEDIFQDEFSAFDAGFNFGASYKLPFDVFFQARYSLGLININNSNLNNNKIRNNVFQFAVGYSF